MAFMDPADPLGAAGQASVHSNSFSGRDTKRSEKPGDDKESAPPDKLSRPIVDEILDSDMRHGKALVRHADRYLRRLRTEEDEEEALGIISYLLDLASEWTAFRASRTTEGSDGKRINEPSFAGPAGPGRVQPILQKDTASSGLLDHGQNLFGKIDKTRLLRQWLLRPSGTGVGPANPELIRPFSDAGGQLRHLSRAQDQFTTAQTARMETKEHGMETRERGERLIGLASDSKGKAPPALGPGECPPWKRLQEELGLDQAHPRLRMNGVPPSDVADMRRVNLRLHADIGERAAAHESLRRPQSDPDHLPLEGDQGLRLPDVAEPAPVSPSVDFAHSEEENGSVSEFVEGSADGSGNAPDIRRSGETSSQAGSTESRGSDTSHVSSVGGESSKLSSRRSNSFGRSLESAESVVASNISEVPTQATDFSQSVGSESTVETFMSGPASRPPSSIDSVGLAT